MMITPHTPMARLRGLVWRTYALQAWSIFGAVLAILLLSFNVAWTQATPAPLSISLTVINAIIDGWWLLQSYRLFVANAWVRRALAELIALKQGRQS